MTTHPTPRARRWSWGVVIAALVATLTLPLFLVQGSLAGFSAKIKNSTDTAGTNPWFKCADAAAGPGLANAYLIYAMNPTALTGVPTTETDRSSNLFVGTYARYTTATGTSDAAKITTVGTSACPRDPTAYVRFNGATCLNPLATSIQQSTFFNTYTIETWFRTSNATTNGRMIEFASYQGGPTADYQYDRSLYINNSGHLSYGVWNGSSVSAITTAGSVANGVWHHAVATQDGSTRLGKLYLDGVLVGTQTQAPQAYGNPSTGFWKIGCGANAGWPLIQNQYYTGDLQYAAVYKTVLTQAQITAQYYGGKP